MKITEPKTPEDFTKYYDLRWRILRKPWNQPPGSEKDDQENQSLHLMATLQNRVLGVIRAHFPTPGTAQIRYMAVDDPYQAKGIGTKLLTELEKRLKQQKIRQITLNARDTAVEFYENNGYDIVGKAPTLYDSIEHFRMTKSLLPI